MLTNHLKIKGKWETKIKLLSDYNLKKKDKHKKTCMFSSFGLIENYETYVLAVAFDVYKHVGFF